jgi:hypothetical protein
MEALRRAVLVVRTFEAEARRGGAVMLDEPMIFGGSG